MPGMDGKCCLVTGATAGIGFYTALEIACMGATVLVIGRNQARCAEAVHRIRMQTGNGRVDYLEADLSSQVQIRTLAERFYQRYDRLDVLVNNAGGIFLRKKISVDGIEMTFALNHLSYFLLTHLLFDALHSCPSARVINVSSGSHLRQRLDFNNLQAGRFYNPVFAYGRSKLANILFTYELSRRLQGTHVTTNALTPGMVATDMWTMGLSWMAPLINTIGKRLAKTPLQGAQTSIYLATSPEVNGVTGKYFANLHPIQSDPYTYNKEIARQLWQISLEYVGLDGRNDQIL